MKIFIPHPHHSEDVLVSGSGASISGHNQARALSEFFEVYHPSETYTASSQSSKRSNPPPDGLGACRSML